MGLADIKALYRSSGGQGEGAAPTPLQKIELLQPSVLLMVAPFYSLEEISAVDSRTLTCAPAIPAILTSFV